MKLYRVDESELSAMQDIKDIKAAKVVAENDWKTLEDETTTSVYITSDGRIIQVGCVTEVRVELITV